MPDQTVVFSNFGFFCNSDGSGTISGIESDIRIGTRNQPKMCLRMQVEEAAKEVGFSYFFFSFFGNYLNIQNSDIWYQIRHYYILYSTI